MCNMKKYLVHPVFKKISKIADDNNVDVYVIGGFVRDIFLKRQSKDIDIVVIGDGINFAQQVAESIKPQPVVNIFKNFGTAMLRSENLEIEFVGARKESYQLNSRKPEVFSGTLEDDQKRRDFTINALAINLRSSHFGQLIDPFDGMMDLNKKIIRTPQNPDKTFSDDPLRMLRAIRFATQLKFAIFEETFQSIIANKERIKIISSERISDELNKILLSQQPSIGFRLMDKSGLLEIIFPEMNQLKGIEVKNGKKHKDNFIHTLKVLDNICEKTQNLWLRWAALLHDIAKPASKRFSEQLGWTFHGHDFLGAKMVPVIFANFKLPLNEKMKYVQKLVQLHLRPIGLVCDEVTDSAVRRLLFEAGDDVDDLMTLCEADITSEIDDKVQLYLSNFKLVRTKLLEIEEKDAVRNFQPPVSGEEIMKTFSLHPCKIVGEIKNTIKDAILDGVIKNDYNEAFHFMIDLGKQYGLTNKAINK